MTLLHRTFIPQTLREDIRLAQDRHAEWLLTYNIDGEQSSFEMAQMWAGTLNSLCEEAATYFKQAE